jgi:tetratricopeptide (TPR) repeat protein
MKTRAIYVLLAGMLAIFTAVAAWPQATLTAVRGVVTDKGKPVAGAQVVLTYLDTGKSYKAKTGKDGSYNMVGLVRGNYDVDVTASNGDKLYHKKMQILAEGAGEENLDIDVSAGGGGQSGQPKLTKEQIEAIKAQNAKAENMNALINQAKAALDAKNYEAAIVVLQQLAAADPTDYEYLSAMGNAQLSLGRYQDAAETYAKGIQAAQNTQPDSKKPYTDPAKVKAAMGQMLTNQGNAYLKINKTQEAIASFTKAAELSPNPGVAYFNLCATQYNTGNTDGAIQACDKAITADPNRADAYFIKGSLMFGLGKEGADKKYTAPAGTSEALNKYLELSPDGPHANDAKAMLQAIGAKIETTYKAGKKKK